MPLLLDTLDGRVIAACKVRGCASSVAVRHFIKQVPVSWMRKLATSIRQIIISIKIKIKNFCRKRNAMEELKVV